MTQISPTSGQRTSAPNDRREKNGNSTFSLSETLPLVKRDYRVAAERTRVAFRDANFSFWRICYVIACLAYRLAELLWNDDSMWEDFQRDPFFAGHSRLNRAHCLRYALMYMYGSHQGRGAERARDHARALLPLWKDQASVREVSATLREGGFRKLKSTQQKRPAVSGGDGARISRQTFQVKNERIGRKLKRFKDGDDVVAHLKVCEDSRGHTVMVVTKVALKSRLNSDTRASNCKLRDGRSARRLTPRDRSCRGRLRASGT